MQQGKAGGFIFAVNALAVFSIGKKIPVPVRDLSHLHGRVVRVKVPVIGLHSPLPAVQNQIKGKISQSAYKNKQQKVQHDRAKSNCFHE